MGLLDFEEEKVNWSLLQEDKCPKCRVYLKRIGGYWVCGVPSNKPHFIISDSKKRHFIS